MADNFEMYRMRICRIAAMVLLLVAVLVSPAMAYEDLREGDRGEAVTALQERLNVLGYSVGTADGAFGNKTQAAIDVFQRINSLEASGIADATTQEHLFSESAIYNMESISGKSIVDALEKHANARKHTSAITTYTYEQYATIEAYFEEFGIEDGKNITIKNWYLAFGDDTLTIYDEFKYARFVYVVGKGVEYGSENGRWKRELLEGIIPDLIEAADAQGYNILSMEVEGVDARDQEAATAAIREYDVYISQMEVLAAFLEY